MTVLNGVRSAAKDVADLTTGLGSIATAPATPNKSVSGETKRYVKKAYGTLFDGFLIIPTVGAGYLLLNPPEDGESLFVRLGTATTVGVVAYAALFFWYALGGGA